MMQDFNPPSLDDHSRGRSFSPAPSRRYRTPPLESDGRRMERRDDISAARGSRSRNERFVRDVASPIPVRKGGRRVDERLREERDGQGHRDLRDARHLRDPRDVRDLKDLRDVVIDPRELREFGDGRDGRDARDFREVRDLRDTLRDRDPLRDTRPLKDPMRDTRDLRDTLRDARCGREVVRTIEWKERKNVSHPVPARRRSSSPPPPPPPLPPPPRDSPHRHGSSASSLKRKSKAGAKVDERQRGDRGGAGGGGGGRRGSPVLPPPPKNRAPRHEPQFQSPPAPSPKPRSSRPELHPPSNLHPKFRDESEQQFHSHRDESMERNHRKGGRNSSDRRETALNSSRVHDGREKRHGENLSSVKSVKERDRKIGEPEKGEKSLRHKDEKFGLLSSKKPAVKPEEKLSDEQSGKNATTIYRDAKTGKKRDLHAEKLEKIEKRRQEEEKKEQYYQWGRGLKQVDEEKERVHNEQHEMSKPLARYADDEDLDKSLKQKEISGLDPMLEYMRRKKLKQDVKEGKDFKPKYKGSWMPNRFNIPPGHKWDGVDRSNGYEKLYFEKQSDKKAMEEEAYKWCSEDM